MTKSARVSSQELHTSHICAMERDDPLSHKVVALNCSCPSFMLYREASSSVASSKPRSS